MVGFAIHRHESAMGVHVHPRTPMAESCLSLGKLTDLSESIFFPLFFFFFFMVCVGANLYNSDLTFCFLVVERIK